MEASQTGGGGGGMMAPPWDLGRGSRDCRENLHNGSVRCTCNLQNYIYKKYLDFPKKLYFNLYELILLIYARNLTFCSKSVNKALKMLIFGVDTLCSILSNCTWKKNPVSKSISYIFYCFMNNFLCIHFFVFSTFCFCCFFWRNLSQTLLEAQ